MTAHVPTATSHGRARATARFSRVGSGSIVRAGACVKQRARFDDRAVLDGFPADQVGNLDAAPPRPTWAFDADDLPTPVRRAP